MAEFNFDAEYEDVKPKEGASGPQHPYIGRAKFTEVSDEPIKNKSGTEFNTFTTSFTLLDEPEEGTVYDHVEWEPDTEKKAVSIFKRISFIVLQYYPVKDDETEDQVYAKVRKQLSASSYDELKQKYVALMKKLKKAGHLDEVKMVKLVAGENNNTGKPVYPKFTNYPGFMADVDGSRELKFSRGENEENMKFKQAILANPTSMSKDDSPSVDDAGEATPEASDDNFDF